MLSRSNSQSAVESLVASCNEALRRGDKEGLASLEAYRDAGAALLELKELLVRGEFGSVADERCNCTKQWRARLMQLARSWDDIAAARLWAEANAGELLRKAYSVDGALAVLKQWRRIQNGFAPQRPSRDAKPSFTSILRESAALRDKLSAAATYVAFLEQKLGDLQSISARPQREELDAKTRDRIEKVVARWHRGGTDGERASALDRLDDIAGRLGWTVQELFRECSIEGPADWSTARTG